ncbi:cation transport protein-domain-containing protein [Stachybotrys elegans]|uniref:Cation transport protein-domain-containing protein n=1 Tax=Stachybotrys elegans TaxID=80388 RepID=A0A8K0SA72_9HYPO|nr:cation transport protein-domain-containing protein [Stachybotrys elegans]
MAVINIAVIATRLYWFERRLKQVDPATTLLNPYIMPHNSTVSATEYRNNEATRSPQEEFISSEVEQAEQRLRVTFDSVLQNRQMDAGTIYTLDRAETGRAGPYTSTLEGGRTESLQNDNMVSEPIGRMQSRGRWRTQPRLALEKTTSIERAASSIFVLGRTQTRSYSRSRSREVPRGSRYQPQTRFARTNVSDLPRLTSRDTVGGHSQTYGMSSEERELLGGMEYRALKLLLWICIGYFVGLHIFGIICLVPWIQNAPSRYLDYLAEIGQDKTWWAFYSAQTMANNLGFTLTPDSMISFRDATFPMLIMTLLAYLGYNFYPVFLRFLIWTFYKLLPKNSGFRAPLAFLLEHPRRCCMLLFPSRPTWILFGILFALNFVDILLLIVLDLNNPTVTELPLAQRILAAIFQAASSRHTGTSTFSLADLNPAAQFSLLVMMYISVYPIALTIRASNTYEEQSLGKFMPEQTDPDEEKTRGKYGIFLICIAESDKIMDTARPVSTKSSLFSGSHIAMLDLVSDIQMLTHPSPASLLLSESSLYAL